MDRRRSINPYTQTTHAERVIGRIALFTAGALWILALDFALRVSQ